MKHTRWIVVLAVAVTLTGATYAGEGHPKCTEDTQTCLNMMAAKLKNYGWVGIEMDQDQETGRLTVTKVVPDSPAMKAGFQEGDVLLAMNGIEFGEENKDRIYQARKSQKIGDQVVYTVTRAGGSHGQDGEIELTVTLARLPDEVMAAWIGSHMLEHAVIDVANNDSPDR